MGEAPDGGAASRLPRPLIVATVVVLGLSALAISSGHAGVVQAAYLVTSVLGAGLLWVGIIVRKPPVRRPWVWLAWAATAWMAADFAYAAYGWLGHPDPEISIADPLYLAGYAFVVLGVLGVIRSRRPERDVDALLDAASITVVGLFLCFEFLVKPTLAGGSWLDSGMTASYPVADVAVLALLVRLLLDTRLRSGVTMLLCASLGTWLVADVSYSLLANSDAYTFGGAAWLDGLWSLGSILLGLAALHPAMGSLTEPQPPVALRPYRLALGVACVSLPGVVAALAAIDGHSVSPLFLLAATTVLALLVLIRSVRLLRQKHAAEEEVRRSDRFHRALAANSADAVVLIEADGTIVTDSPALAALVGYTDAPTAGVDVFVLVDSSDLVDARGLLDTALRRPGQVLTGEFRVRHADGSIRWVAARVVNRVDDPDIEGVVVNFHDITLRKHMEEELNHQAFHDSLTGLANRLLFREHAESAVRRARRNGEQAAILYCDLDGFKTINDSLGHDTGDEVLRAVAERLRQTIRESDTVARLGGDEFAVLISPTADPKPGAIRLADRLVAALSEPIDVGDSRVSVGVSIGIAAGDNRAEALLRNADVAMYRAKSVGKRRWVLFDDGMREAAVERLQLESDLFVALDQDQLELHFQPIVELADGRITGFEALLRWNHPDLGVVAPDRFIPIAEETGLIVPIGHWVLREAVQMLARWQRRQDDDALTMSVNVSARQLSDSDLVDAVADVLATTAIAPATLILEMTESSLVRDPATAAQRLHELRALGVRLAIDDFGTGYSSLSYLRQFPVDTLKIDRSFVSSLAADDDVPALVSALLDLSRALDLETIAEGIELPHQVDQLRGERCHLGQGFLFARPLTAAAAEGLLDRPSLRSTAAR